MQIMSVLHSKRAFSNVLVGLTKKNFMPAPFARLKPLFCSDDAPQPISYEIYKILRMLGGELVFTRS